MKVHRNAPSVSVVTICMIAMLMAGCITDDQAAIASTGDPISALIGFAVDFGRQFLAAFLF